MLNDLWGRWLLLSAFRRGLSLVGLGAAVTLTLYLLTIQPQQERQQLLLAEVARYRYGYQQQLSPLRQRPPLRQQLALNQQLRSAMLSDDQPFSLHSALEQSGGVLDKWQPDTRPAQLTLRLSWLQLRQFFAWLAACYPPPVLTRLELERDDALLHAAFSLDLIDETTVD